MIISATSSNHIHRAFTGRCAILLKPGLNCTEEERTSRLRHMSDLQQQRTAEETFDKRTSRLQHLSDLQQQQIAAETDEERASRLQHMSDLQQQRIASETPDERATRISAAQERLQNRTLDDEKLPKLEHRGVQAKMQSFHRDIAALSSPTCITCMEIKKRNNKYYRNISLNTFALSQLPEDGDLTDQCGVGIDDTMERDEEEGPPAAAAEEEDPTDVDIHSSGSSEDDREGNHQEFCTPQATEQRSDRALAREWKCTHR